MKVRRKTRCNNAYGFKLGTFGGSITDMDDIEEWRMAPGRPDQREALGLGAFAEIVRQDVT